jgi:hypothetical protein
MGTRSGPTSFLPPQDLIQNEDVTESIMYVLNSSPRACPSRIILFPQKQVISSMRKMRDECDITMQQEQQQQQQPNAKL